MKIVDIRGREILDSRGTPTVEVDVILKDGTVGRFAVPSGASTGEREALELRDKESRYLGKGVRNAVNNVNGIIKDTIVGMDVGDQREIDNKLIRLDGTKNKSKLGANAILGVSGAVLKAAAFTNGKKLYEYIGNGKTLPNLMVNIINGGRHANNKIEFQEFMIVPLANSVSTRIMMASEIFHTLKKILDEKGLSTTVGDEGGFAPNFKNNTEVLDIIMQAIEKANYKAGENVFLALDVAASEFYEDGVYKFDKKIYDGKQMIRYYKKLIDKYPIISIEDPLDQNDWESFKALTKEMGDRVRIVGDDLFVSNVESLANGIKNKCCNSILLKLNQIGTISEALDTINMARDNDYEVIISHRSGETEDTTIADLAVGLSIDKIKTGSMSRSERICKYNQLLRIEEDFE